MLNTLNAFFDMETGAIKRVIHEHQMELFTKMCKELRKRGYKGKLHDGEDKWIELLGDKYVYDPLQR